MLLAWADGATGQDAIDELAAPGSAHLVLGFNAVPGGAVLEAG